MLFRCSCQTAPLFYSKGSFFVYIFAIRLLLNHSPSEWFSLYKKLPSFPALSQDVFQSFYSLMPRKNGEDMLSVAARKFNTPIFEQSVVEAANKAESKRRQVEAVGKLVDANAAKSRDDVAGLVSLAVSAAAEKAEEVRNIIGAWSDDPGNLERNEANADLLALVRKSQVLRDIAKYLGRFREIFAQGKRNGYSYGRGEKYALELGRDLSRALTSELAMLASPQTTPLFLRRYQRGQSKQYQRREPTFKGMGNIICCLDESDSTHGDPAAWERPWP